MSLFSVLSVSASGMAAQRARAELLVENLANAETTRTPEGGPYRRKDAVFETALGRSRRSRRSSARRLQTIGRGRGVGDRRRTTAIRNGATCPAIPTPTRTATWPFRR